MKLIEIWPTLGEDVVEAILQLAGQLPDELTDANDVTAESGQGIGT